MKITFFLRKPNQSYFSIEQLFHTIIDYLPDEKTKFTSSYFSTGIINRIKICFEAKKNQGDINHITGDIHFLALALPKKKTILTIHDCRHIQKIRSLKDFIYWLFWFYLPVKRVNVVTVISEATKKELLKIVKVDPQKIKVVYNCVFPIFKFSAKEFNKAHPVILQIGTSANKNLERLIPALKGIPCKLVIIGKINETILNSLKEHKVKFENKYDLSQHALLNEYQNCDIVSFISTYEGFGLPIIEANAVGRPVITSNVSSMPEIAADAALLVNPFSIDEIRNGILKLINDDIVRNQIIKNGLDNIQRFQPEKIALQYSALYNQISDHDTIR